MIIHEEGQVCEGEGGEYTEIDITISKKLKSHCLRACDSIIAKREKD